MTKIDPSIFRDYDIRGIYPEEINEETFYIIGKAICSFLNVTEIAVGRDCRLSSPSLFQAIIEGIIDSNVNVADLGLISTEMHNFASGYYKFPANIIISASHNPPQYNGIKILTRGVVALHGDSGLPEIKKLTLKQDFPETKKKGTIRKVSILEKWITHALSSIDIVKLKKLKVVVDAGNGMGGISWEKMIDNLPVKIIPLYFEPDGRFPHHLPDPLNGNNLADLKKAIVENKADLGFALDGDADRLFVLDENGNIVSGTITSAILAEHILKKEGPGSILYNTVCGRIIPEITKKLGGRELRVRVGHSFIKETMKKTGALFAGEHSGHMYFKNNFNADSSLIAGLILLESLSSKNKPLSDVVKEFDKYRSSGEINYRVKNVSEILQKVEKNYSDAVSIDHIDGLSVWYSDWWFNLRASKTEPLLRFNLEADNNRILYDKIKDVENNLFGLGAVKV